MAAGQMNFPFSQVRWVSLLISFIMPLAICSLLPLQQCFCFVLLHISFWKPCAWHTHTYTPCHFCRLLLHSLLITYVTNLGQVSCIVCFFAIGWSLGRYQKRSFWLHLYLTGSSGLSPTIIILSLPGHVRVVCHKVHHGVQISDMAWHSINRDVLWAVNFSDRPNVVFGRTETIGDLSFQPCTIIVNHVGQCSSRCYVVLWCDILCCGTLCFSGSDSLNSSLASLNNAITWGGHAHSRSKVRILTCPGTTWITCCKRLCHFQSKFQPAGPAHNTIPSNGQWRLLYLADGDVTRW